ncbi:uncharacterized protein LOC124636999 [Helicoverpa zea]|uniref:uncharacterized protein LOC124636999 n=1 Tax=Helicoverpa zea TaxID=7113 RepID=UPI001F5842DC|nr:uncharacterized protein LOC124636999 [Helicoverpa zea]
MMLTEVEERIVALCGGESFSTGDAHLGIQPFPVRNSEMQLENDTPSPSPEAQPIYNTNDDNINVPQQQQSQARPTEESAAIVFYVSYFVLNMSVYDVSRLYSISIYKY